MASKWRILFFVVMVAATFYSSAAQRVHVVGDAVWRVPTPVNYTTWASSQTFTVRDILVFNFTTGFHDVAEVTSAAYNTCSAQSPISISTTGPTNISLSAAGQHFYICTFPSHCDMGQKLAINVVSDATSTTPTPQPTLESPAPAPTPVSINVPTSPTPSPTPSSASASVPVPTPSVPVPAPSPASASVPVPAPSPVSASVPVPAPSPARLPATYVVGDALNWTVPPSRTTYQDWASNKTFLVGDTLVFNFPTGRHDVVQLTSKADYGSCSNSSASTTIFTGPARILLNNPGENFFICTFTSHCSLGQKLAINVTGTSSPTSPSGPIVAPSAPTTPGDTTPSSPNSAPNVVMAALPITLLSIVFALFH